MIQPNMATMLSFLTTDAAIAADALKKALKDCADKGCVCVVGCDSALKEFGDMPVFDV